MTIVLHKVHSFDIGHSYVQGLGDCYPTKGQICSGYRRRSIVHLSSVRNQWRSQDLEVGGGGTIGVNFLQIVGGLMALSFPPSFSSLPLPSPSFPSPPLPSLSLEVGPQIQLGGLGERCKLPQWGLGRSPSRNRIWCILALKSVIWWQLF